MDQTKSKPNLHAFDRVFPDNERMVTTKCPDPILHEILDWQVRDLTELVKAAVLCIEDLPPALLRNHGDLTASERAAYDRLAAAVRKIK